MAPPADAILAFASAFPLLILGAALLLLRPHRSPQVFFGLFALLWAAQILLANVGRLHQDADRHYFTLLLSQALLPVVALFLAHFATTTRRRRHGWLVGAFFALIAAATAAVLLIDPLRVVESVELRDGQLSTTFGPLAFALFHAPLRLAFYLALVVTYVAYRGAKPGTPRRRVRGILLALALYASYDTVRLLLAYLLSDDGFAEFSSSAIQTAGGLIDLTSTLFLVAGVALIATLAAHAFLRPPPPEEPDAPLLVAFLFPAGVAIAEELLAASGFRLETLGFWRFLMVGVIVYTLASYQLFDLELKVKRFAAPMVAGILVLFGIPILLTLALGEFGTGPFIFALVPQIVGAAGVVVFQERVKNALFPGVAATPDYMHQRRLDIYRVALEDTLQRGGTSDDEELKELRLKNGITEQEHTILAWVITSGSTQRTPTPTGGASFETGDVVLERYRLVRRLGRGTYGRTFLAQDIRTRREVAIKTVRHDAHEGDAARLLLREARLAAGIDDPNVIEIVDVAELPDRVVVVMEYADNGNLEDYMKRTGHLAFPDSVRFLSELLRALEAVHAKGIVHRNLKPKNILIEADDSVRLSDFGAAAAERTEDRTEAATRTLLDILYQSPEQLEGRAATPQSDLFVAAVLFHQAATGRFPFPLAGKSDYQIRETIRNAQHELNVGDLPAWVAPFLEAALAREPSARPRDAAAMRQALAEAAGLGGRSRRR